MATRSAFLHDMLATSPWYLWSPETFPGDHSDFGAQAYVTLMFSAGLPLLLPIAVAGFIVSYWVDKITFIRFYRTPPSCVAVPVAGQRCVNNWCCRYDTSVGRAASAVLSWVLMIHLVVALVRMSRWLVGVFC